MAAKVKVQEAQDQEQRAIALVKKNAELERRLHEMEERDRVSKRRTNVIELKDNPSSDSGTTTLETTQHVTIICLHTHMLAVVHLCGYSDINNFKHHC